MTTDLIQVPKSAGFCYGFLGLSSWSVAALAILLSLVAILLATWALCVSIKLGQRPSTVVAHLVPPLGAGLTPCCGRTIFELDYDDRLVTDPDHVTCPEYRR